MTMKRINEIVEQYKASPANIVEQKKAPELSENDRKIVNAVLERLQVSFPAWRVAFPTERSWKLAKQEWTMALVNSGCVTEQMLACGFKVARESNIPFFPSPGMFIEWCTPRPEHFGLPSSEQAFNEVIRRLLPSHPAVLKAYKQTSFERKTADHEKYKQVYIRAYEMLAAKVMRCESIEDDITKGIENLTGRKKELSGDEYYEAGKRNIGTLRDILKHKSNI